MWELAGIDGPSQAKVYAVFSKKIGDWIEEHPTNMWNYYEIPAESVGEVSLRVLVAPNYLFTKEMEVLFLLRWS